MRVLTVMKGIHMHRTLRISLHIATVKQRKIDNREQNQKEKNTTNQPTNQQIPEAAYKHTVYFVSAAKVFSVQHFLPGRDERARVATTTLE